MTLNLLLYEFTAFSGDSNVSRYILAVSSISKAFVKRFIIKIFYSDEFLTISSTADVKDDSIVRGCLLNIF